MLKNIFILFMALGYLLPTQAQDIKSKWIDSVFQTLTVNQKIGQLFMLPVSARTTSEQVDVLRQQIRSFSPGGLLVTGGGPNGYAKLANSLQQISSVPLLTGIHAEWGLGQTLDSTMSFQKPLLLGAVRSDSLITGLGAEIAREMKVLGLHINFAPQADVDVDQNYPLGYFSSNPSRVTNQALAFVRGLQQHGVMACAKHFPKEQPIEFSTPDRPTYFNINEIDSSDFSPFIQLFRQGVGGMLTTQLHFFTPGKKTAVPASVSQVFVNEILKQSLGFKGLTFTEVPYLKRLLGKERPGEAEKTALEIGNDIMIAPANMRKAVKKIARAVKKDENLMSQLNGSVRKILAAKFDAGLSVSKLIDTDNLVLRLNSPQARLLKHTLAEAAVTVVKNQEALVPIRHLENKKFLAVSVGKDGKNEFTHYLSKYAQFQSVTVRSSADSLTVENALPHADVVVFGIFSMADTELSKLLPVLKKWMVNKPSIVCLFSNPYLLRNFEDASTIIASYTDADLLPQKTAQVIFGGLPASGILPVEVTPAISEGKSVTTTSLNRFSYTTPEAAGMDSRTLAKIKSIAQDAIDIGATPGCNIFVARHGKVVFEQSMGWQTYDNKIAMDDETIFDLASITKVSATLQAIMFLQEKGMIDVHKKASVYLPELKGSDKEDLTIKDILTHQAGLWPTIFFWTHTVKDSSFLPEYYSSTQSAEYPFPVSKNLFAHKTMKDSLWQWTIKGKMREKVPRTPFDYRYSDMGLYIMHYLAERLLNQPIENFLDQNFYGPLGAYTTGYLPLNRFPESKIAPTENDKTFRKSQLIGYVHDQGAAMHGGIAGHAGLFSSANDLAKLGQMWLNKGSYGGIQYFKPETLDLFTQKQYETSRRGLGWDKPPLSDWNASTSTYASPRTFGHTGFTGTCIWIDPQFDLVYVFLSNRVYPNMLNNKISDANIRPRIHDEIYRSIFNYSCSH